MKQDPRHIVSAFPELRAGDVLLYGGADPVSLAIQFRTWSDVCHVEIHIGNSQSVASRNGVGVGRYLFRADGLRYVMRNPGLTTVQFQNGMDWFRTVDGQPYNWGDLLRFYGIQSVKTKGMICSQFGAEFFRQAGAPLFSTSYPSGEVCPSDNLVTKELSIIWSYK